MTPPIFATCAWDGAIHTYDAGTYTPVAQSVLPARPNRLSVNPSSSIIAGHDVLARCSDDKPHTLAVALSNGKVALVDPLTAGVKLEIDAHGGSAWGEQ